MRRLRVNLILCLVLIAVSAAFSAFAIFRSLSVWQIAVGVTTLFLACIGAYRLALATLRQTATFVKSIEMEDFTVRFPMVADKALNEIHVSMNRIIALHKERTNALETRKLYYDRILRIMTHELRNGITPIVSLSEDMEIHPQRYAGDNLTEAISVIADESRSIKRFLDSYYELTHLPKPEIRPVDAVEFFSRMRKSFCMEAEERGVKLDFSVAREMRMPVDSDMMRRVVSNLISNALNAVEGGKDPRITVTASMPGGRLFITVSDNGCGISPRVMENLFQPFFTTRPDGNGIGLCLSRQIVRLHGGDIDVSSTEGHGTTFRITL